MIIALGSTSQEKISYLKKIFGKNKIEAEVFPVAVESGVPDQPMGKEIVVKGAKNRALHALRKISEAEIGVGMEGGLVRKKGNFYLFCAAAIINREENFFLGVSKELPLPQEVSWQIEEKKEFGVVIRDYASKKGKDKDVEELISREKSFSRALQQALDQYKKFLN